MEKMTAVASLTHVWVRLTKHSPHNWKDQQS